MGGQHGSYYGHNAGRQDQHHPKDGRPPHQEAADKHEHGLRGADPNLTPASPPTPI